MLMCKSWPFRLFVFLAVIAGACSPAPDSSETTADVAAAKPVLVVYTTQHLPSDDSLYINFENQQGIRVEIVEWATHKILPALQDSSVLPRPDVVVFPEVGLAASAKSQGLLQFHSLPGLTNYYKSMARDEEGYWTGLSRKHYAIAYAQESVEAEAITSFEGLADDIWKTRLLLPPADDPFLISFIASRCIHFGKEATLGWMKNILNNQAVPPLSSAKSRIQALARGQADVTLINAGDLGLLRYPPTYQELVEGNAVKLFIPAHPQFFSHVNISCATVPKGGKLQYAQQFIRFMASQAVQDVYAAQRHEFPVHVMSMPSPFIVEEMGGLREDELELEILVDNRKQAMQLLKEAGWPQQQVN
jgi:iron(III) transport system substrate-binding protein